LPNTEIIDLEFIYYYFRIFEGAEKLSDASLGTVDQNKTLNTKCYEKSTFPFLC
jgi:hypothetical protein